MSIYTPRHFVCDDSAAIARVLDEFGFATLITTVVGAETMVSHVPLLHEASAGPHGVLIGHVAAANPHAAVISEGATFAVFHGPQGYVSPNWYENPASSVPTWNYVAVHVHGCIERIDRLDAKRDIVDQLSSRYESSFPTPWTSAKMEPALLDRMLGAIVGFRMTIERIDAKFKLTQNRSAADRAGVIDGLETRGSASERALAHWMRMYSSRA
jgi:transcriptional regulator